MAKIKRVVADTVPEPAPERYSNCLRVGDTIYVSGQHAGEPDGTVAGDGTAADQALRTFAKIQALVEAAGATLDDVVKLTIFLTDISKRGEIGDVRRTYFRGDFPCSTLVGVAALGLPGLVVEIEAIAVRGAGRKH